MRWSIASVSAPLGLADPPARFGHREPELNFRYVEREIIPTRTQHRPTYEEGIAGSRYVWTLCSRTYLQGAQLSAPEAKVADDKDPYTGLVQALAGASQLVSLSQRRV